MKNAHYLTMLVLATSVVTTDVSAKVDGHRIKRIVKHIKNLPKGRRDQIKANFSGFTSSVAVAMTTGDARPLITKNIEISKNLINNIGKVDKIHPAIISSMIAVVDQIGQKAVIKCTSDDAPGALAEIDTLEDKTMSAADEAENKIKS